jgi:RNA polymerase sigma-70 factor (ECF subfamily)
VVLLGARNLVVSEIFPLWRVWARAAPPLRDDDDGLMARAAAGDTEAYARLVRRYQGAVRAYCVRLTGNRTAGDDVAQEVFLTLWQSRSRYEERGRFRSFLFTLARNACHNQKRSRVGDLAMALEVSELVCEDDPHDEIMVRNERRRRVHDSVARLPFAQRDALLLRYAADLEYAEIALILGKSEATVRSRVFLGLARLRRILGK